MLALLFLLPISVQAQLTSASYFPQMKALNPAAITGRPIGIFSAGALLDDVSKSQNIATTSTGASAFGEGSTAETKVELMRYQVFYGGKSSGGFTTEFTANKATGDKTFTLSQTGSTQSGVDTVDSTFLNFGIGLGKIFGVSVGLVKDEFTSKFNSTFGGQTFSSNYTSSITAPIIRAGVIIPMGVNLSLYYEHAAAEIATSGEGSSTSVTTNFGRVGIGIGLNGSRFHFEAAIEQDISYEAPAGESIPGQEELTPQRANVTLEMRLGGLVLGYTGRYYIDGFADLENLAYNNFIYAGSFDEPRLENFINFALGVSKGHSFSGSVYYSKGESVEGLSGLIDGNKYATSIEAQGASVQYGFSW